MSLLALQQPAAFLPHPGEPTMLFPAWIRMFENYILAASPEVISDGRKRALLIHCLGTEGQRIFYTLSAGDTYATALAALQNFFVPKVNVVAERYRFRQRGQHNGESTVQYIATLRELAVTCEFGALAEEMIRDQLVEKTNSSRIRERLLLEQDLTLTKAITLSSHIESAMADAKTLIQGTTDIQMVKSDGTSPKPHSSYTDTAKDPSKVQSRAAYSQNGYCFRCGSAQHRANYTSCPAKAARCRKCNKVGHFEKVCRTSPDKQVHEVTAPEVTVLSIDQHAGSIPDKLLCTVQVTASANQSHSITLMLDTGSAVSILPEDIYLKCFENEPLTAPTLKLVSYLRDPIPVLGCLLVTVQFHSNRVQAEFYIVKKGTAILGRDLFAALHLQLVDGLITTAPTSPMQPVSNISPLQDVSLGCAKDFVHKIRVRPDVQPVCQKLRRLPFSVRDAVSKEIYKLLDQDVVEKIEASEWVSPIVVTIKKSGGIRLCVDLREPNKAIVIDSHPLPHIEEVFSELRGAKFFSTLDLQSAYHQVLLHEESRDLTAFITHEGLFRFKRVPYGLASAPGCFQRLMNLTLHDIPGVQCYLDDIIVYGPTLELHDKYLKIVLHRLQSAGLKLNSSKCCFRQTQLSFLGHIISQDGLLPDPEHVQAVIHAPAPSDFHTLRAFLGLTSWYSKFIPNYASVVEPMRVLLRGNASMTWSEAAQHSFEAVKQLIVNSTALALFDPSLPTIVTTDASDYGLGAVLTQCQADLVEKTVAFASRTLTETERKYSTVEKEALACVWATEKWRTYLWGRQFTLRTDHSPLTTLLTTKGLGRAGMRVARWSARLLNFNYVIQYKPGVQNVTADCLSRLPLPVTTSTLDEDAEVVAVTDVDPVTASEFQQACLACPVQLQLRDMLQSKWPNSENKLSAILKPYYRIRHELSLVEGYIVRGSYRLLVPEALRAHLINLAHESHQGIVRTKQRLRELYWWPGMDAQVVTAIQTCVTCQSHDKSAVTHTPPLQPVPFPDSAWEKLAIDIVGPFPEAPMDCRFAITLMDYYSKWPEIAFVSHTTSASVITFLTTVFSREGNPKELVSDNGPQFVSSEFETFLRQRNIVHRKSSVYYPQANGEIERFNRSLKEALQTAKLTGRSWKVFTTEFLHVYRATQHATTQASPAELLHGRKMRTRLHVADIPLPQRSVPLRPAVAKTVQQQQDKSKAYTDRKRGAKEVHFQCGDLVRVKKPGLIKQGQFRFSNPLKVASQRGPYTYKLSDGRTWNASRLAPVRHDFADVPLEALNLPTPTDNQETGHQDSEPPPYTQRIRKPPLWTKDYVM